MTPGLPSGDTAPYCRTHHTQRGSHPGEHQQGTCHALPGCGWQRMPHCRYARNLVADIRRRCQCPCRAAPAAAGSRRPASRRRCRTFRRRGRLCGSPSPATSASGRCSRPAVPAAAAAMAAGSRGRRSPMQQLHDSRQSAAILSRQSPAAASPGCRSGCGGQWCRSTRMSAQVGFVHPLTSSHLVRSDAGTGCAKAYHTQTTATSDCHLCNRPLVGGNSTFHRHDRSARRCPDCSRSTLTVRTSLL